MAKNNEQFHNSEYWEERIANETWKTYNSAEEKNRDLIEMYNKTSNAIKKELYTLAETAEEQGGMTRTQQYRMNKLLGQQGEIFKQIEKLGEQIEKGQSSRIKDAGKTVYGNVMDALGVDDFSYPSKKTMEQMLRSPWHGSFFSERLWQKMSKLERNLNGVINDGVSTGKTVTEMAISLSNIMNKSFNDAHRLVRTETINYMNRSALRGYTDAGIKRVQWWAAEDERTCEICGANHEKEYDIDKAPVLPCHPGCRCTWIPVIDSVKTLDIDKDSDTMKVVDGKNLVGDFVRRKGYALDIEDILNRQGFDGLPKTVKSETEFYQFVTNDHFLAERTFSSDNAQDIDQWYQQLKSGDFYVKCSEGGFQYGRGMYCAADYSKGEVKYENFLHEINQYSWNKKHVKTTWLTMDPSARIIDFNNIQEEYAFEWLKYKYPDKTSSINTLRQLNKEVNEYKKTWDPVFGTPTEEFKNLIVKKNKLSSEVNFNEGIIQANRRCKEDGYDLGILAAEMGYDAINAAGHGKTGSYTVILNRTKLIIFDGKDFKYRKR